MSGLNASVLGVEIVKPNQHLYGFQHAQLLPRSHPSHWTLNWITDNGSADEACESSSTWIRGSRRAERSRTVTAPLEPKLRSMLQRPFSQPGALHFAEVLWHSCSRAHGTTKSRSETCRQHGVTLATNGLVLQEQVRCKLVEAAVA